MLMHHFGCYEVQSQKAVTLPACNCSLAKAGCLLGSSNLQICLDGLKKAKENTRHCPITA